MDLEWKKISPVVMLVLDGFGVTLEREGNAILNANIPNFDRLWNDYPHALLNASGESVGLPWGEYGNSEVGHITLGMGAVIKQSLALIKDSIESGQFYNNDKIVKAIAEAKRKHKKLHVAGIFSSAGVHGHVDYFAAILRTCKKHNFRNVYLHLFADGRDVPPQSFMDFWEDLSLIVKEIGFGQVASVAGRFYAMDRISRWDRTDLAYQAMLGIGKETASNVEELIENSYANGIFDEQIIPRTIVDSHGRPIGPIEAGDSIIFTNHRRDRIRQIASFFVSDEEVIKQTRQTERLTDLQVVSMVFYELINMGVKVAFSPQEINKAAGEVMSLPRVISEGLIRQYHVAETEKFPHVTYFFNGGEKAQYSGEEYVHVPSPKVRGYEEKPEMSLPEVTEKLLAAINSDQYGFLLSNFANPDMIGHTGEYGAGVRAVEYVDQCVGRVVEATLKKEGTVLITADHGNCEEMINPISKNISKEHSSNPVPFFMIDDRFKFDRRQKMSFADAGELSPNGLLADVAPTVLEMLDIGLPGDMSGVSLFDALN
ncbi:MAG: 2,3-bisphosphoglycerate-independent phosphoglycerate mutase [Patescibacteria group bacterium]